MPKYRKKPVEVEAVHQIPENWNEVCEFLVGDSAVSEANPGYLIDDEGNPTDDLNANRMAVKVCTAQGQWVQVATGEWIIAESPDHPGRYYPCDPDIFAATYDPVGA